MGGGDGDDRRPINCRTSREETDSILHIKLRTRHVTVPQKLRGHRRGYDEGIVARSGKACYHGMYSLCHARQDDTTDIAYAELTRPMKVECKMH